MGRICGEMFVSAMLAVAAVTNNIEDIIPGGLAEIPYTSRLYEDIMSVLNDFKDGVSQEECFNKIHEKYDEYTKYGWCHTISNAMIVTIFCPAEKVNAVDTTSAGDSFIY